MSDMIGQSRSGYGRSSRDTSEAHRSLTKELTEYSRMATLSSIWTQDLDRMPAISRKGDHPSGLSSEISQTGESELRRVLTTDDHPCAPTNVSIMLKTPETGPRTFSPHPWPERAGSSARRLHLAVTGTSFTNRSTTIPCGRCASAAGPGGQGHPRGPRSTRSGPLEPSARGAPRPSRAARAAAPGRIR